MKAGGFHLPRLSASVFESPAALAGRAQSESPRRGNGARLHHVRPCSWTDALATPRGARLFISPPVEGWIVVMGSDLPIPR